MTRVVLLKQELAAKGGLEKSTLRIANSFKAKGCNVVIVTATPLDQCPPSFDIPIVSFPLKGLLHYTRLKNWDAICRHYMAAYPADTILSFDRTSYQTHIRAGNGIHAAYLANRCKYVSKIKQNTFAINPLHRTILRLEKQAFTSPLLQRLIVNSFMVQKEAIDFYGVSPSLIQVVHNGVEWTELSREFENWPITRREVAQEIGSDADAFHFLFVGHEYHRKGLDQLLLGLQALSSDDVRLLVIGRDKNSADYREKARRLGLRHVYFLGPRSDIHRFYALADAAVIPSLYDPFANVTVEALAMGLFVISSRFNGGAEVLEKNSGAIIPELQDPDSVTESLALALQRPKTKSSAAEIRDSVRFLDYPLQLERFVAACSPS